MSFNHNYNGWEIYLVAETLQFFLTGVYVEKFHCKREISRQGREVAVIQTTIVRRFGKLDGEWYKNLLPKYQMK